LSSVPNYTKELVHNPYQVQSTATDTLIRRIFMSSNHTISTVADLAHLGFARANPSHKPEQPTIIAWVNAAIEQAYTQGASDIHFESTRTGLQLKYRQDGVMQWGAGLDGNQQAEQIISRIKVMAQLDITERRRPQDGRIHWQHKQLDLRVSIMPSLFGEDAVLRLLDKAPLREQHSGDLTLSSLGFDNATATQIRALATRPHGMLLITGPTGSGKTTTAYAALSEVNDGLEKIITIEDPIEYELLGTLQIPVNEQKGLTFATGLRSILRHDPDKILVGEIRDAETAQIAVQSALTGHLVFTTVHANHLPDVLGRFQHFGIDPFGLASAINGIVVQRLLRQTCQHCQGRSKRKSSDQSEIVTCNPCNNTGYKGRFVLAEVHTLNATLRDMMIQRSSLQAMEAVLAQSNQANLYTQAMAYVAAGKTTTEEVLRVIGAVHE
jgi:general secretion pathway protein E